MRLEDALKQGLAKPATSEAEMPARRSREERRAAHESDALRGKLRAKLIAAEYLRNGMRFGEAYKTVTKRKTCNKGLVEALGEANTEVFLQEISAQLDRVNIDKDDVLKLLWANALVSPVDFYADDGTPMTVAQLKKLPREMRALIEQVETETKEVALTDKDGKVVTDPEGKPYVTLVTKTKLKVPDKIESKRLIAQIMRWVGPLVSIQNNNIVNAAVVMVDADRRRERLLKAIDEGGQILEHNGVSA